MARKGATLVCGGRGGVMEAACHGAAEEGGVTIGILPGGEIAAANRYVQIPVATNMGHARNLIIIHSAHALIALPGGHGTMMEIAAGLKIGRTVVAFPPWEVAGTLSVQSAEEAVSRAMQAAANR